MRIRTLAAAAGITLCWWCCFGGVPAGAHTELQSSSPQQGAVLDAAPKTVRLTFTEDLGAGSLAVTVAGQAVGAGASRVEGSELVLDIATGSPAGAWTVAYRVVSADGHPVTGQFAFAVRQARTSGTPTPSATPPAPTASATPTAIAPATGAANGRATQHPAVEVAVTALALVALVVGVFARRRRR